MRKGKLIGICGYKGAGKTELSDAAIRQLPPRPQIIKIGFSDPLYKIMNSIGVPQSIIDDKSKWNIPLDALEGKTLRFAIQTLGTEWGRNTIGQNIWANRAIDRATPYRHQGVHVVIDNVRFPSEFETIEKAGGQIIALIRPGLEIDLSHESEQHIERLQKYCHARVINDGEFQQIAGAMRIAISSIINA